MLRKVVPQMISAIFFPCNLTVTRCLFQEQSILQTLSKEQFQVLGEIVLLKAGKTKLY